MKHSITKYIAKNRADQSRYEIDLFLLGAGYAPEQIEEAWEQVMPSSAKPKKKRFIPKFFSVVEFWVLIDNLVLVILAFRPIMPTGAGAKVIFLCIFCIVGLFLLDFWSQKQKANRVRRGKLLIGAYIWLFLVIAYIPFIFFGDLLFSYNPLQYEEIGSVPANNHTYYAIYGRACCEPPVNEILLYRCDFVGLLCSEIEKEEMSSTVDLSGSEKYDFSIDRVGNNFIITNRNEVIYTFRAT